MPLTYRAAPLDGAEHALLGTMEHSVLGTRWVYDGPHDPVYVGQLMATILGAGVSDEAQASVGQQRRWRPGPRRVASTGPCPRPRC